MYRKLWLLCVVLCLAACQAAPTTPIPTPFPADFSSTIQVGDYSLSLTCKGTGEPTIILENGLDYLSWKSATFSNISRTCYYARAGMGTEQAKGPRTTQDQVNDLHSLLQKNGVPGPYILVGHSIASFNILVYADQYPAEVAGLVCVDCRYPVVETIFLEKLNAQLASDPEKDQKIKTISKKFSLTATNPDIVLPNREGLNLNKSAGQVSKIASLGDLPFFVLVAGLAMGESTSTSHLFFECWGEAAQKLSKLSTQSRIETVPFTTHLSILTNDAVAKAVKEVYDQAKKAGKK